MDDPAEGAVWGGSLRFCGSCPSVKRDEGNGEAVVGMVGGGVFEDRGDFGEGGLVAGVAIGGVGGGDLEFC